MKKDRRVIFQAGHLWYAKQYTPLRGASPPSERRERQRYSTRIREAINFRLSYEKLWLILECNFTWRDLFVTLSYRDENLPRTREEADKRLDKFIRELRADRKSKGIPLVYVRTTEGFHTGGRLHHHLFINATGEDFKVIRRLWKKNGDDVDILPYYCKAPIDHAKYVTKEPRTLGRRHVGDRTWRVSRNCKRPIVTCEDVPKDSNIPVPLGAFIETEDTSINSFGRFQYIAAILSAERPNSGLG